MDLAEIKRVAEAAEMPYIRWKNHGRVVGDDQRLQDLYSLVTPELILELVAQIEMAV